MHKSKPEERYEHADYVRPRCGFRGVGRDDGLRRSVENSTFPNWNGVEQKRPFTVTGDELKYSIATGSGGGTVVVWKRSK